MLTLEEAVQRVYGNFVYYLCNCQNFLKITLNIPVQCELYYSKSRIHHLVANKEIFKSPLVLRDGSP